MEANDKRLAQCQQVIGYYFSNPRLLETALTHSSLRAPDRECNERLEFLGDSILGMVITEELYHLLPDQSEGDLTRIKKDGNGPIVGVLGCMSQNLQDEMLDVDFSLPATPRVPDGLWPTVVCDEQGIALGLAYSNPDTLAEARASSSTTTAWAR